MNRIAANNNAREVALEILYDIEVKHAYGNISFDRRLKAADIGRRDTGLVTELVFGTLRWKLQLDYIIGCFSKIPLDRISPVVMNVLRIGAYQLLHLDRIPPSAAVNESVKMVKKHGVRSASGFVNGILRNIGRKKNSLVFPDKERDPVGYLSVTYSHPRWMAKRWLERYGFSFACELLDSNNEKPDFMICVNTLKNSPGELAEILERIGFRTRSGRYSGEALIVDNPSGIMDTLEYQEGRFMVQDEGAMLVSRLLAPEPGDHVIDLCSAPGGKAVHMAQLMKNRGKLSAWDIHGHRLKLLNRNKSRTGSSIIDGVLLDASKPHDEYGGKADRVLADVPCSGLGTIRRKPDIKWVRREHDIMELAGLQHRILELSAGYLKPGGIMVYSACTVEPEENEDVVNRFLEGNKEYIIEAADVFLPEQLKGAAGKDGMARLYPCKHKVDGFFMARIRRIR